jgi:hypothetical protein
MRSMVVTLNGRIGGLLYGHRPVDRRVRQNTGVLSRIPANVKEMMGEIDEPSCSGFRRVPSAANLSYRTISDIAVRRDLCSAIYGLISVGQ